MRKIRTVVVDDEPLARRRIISLLEKYSYIQLVGECKNGREAVKKINSYQPDLVFLDIQMPDLNGLDVIRTADSGPMPFIIFVTAYDNYALEAFHLHAVDYLLKPFDNKRFEEALEHAKKQIGLKEKALLHEKMIHLIHEHQTMDESGPQTLTIKKRGRTVHVPIDDINWVEADGNYLHLHLESDKFLLRQTMQGFFDGLRSRDFFRIHRSLLLNSRYLDKVRYLGNNRYLFQMRNGTELHSGRSFRGEIEEYLTERDMMERL
ncbi:MAG: response regulator transcription factor [Saprospiraceae bacterium]|nr:response regulator transcription factor [Saprospiraceae bacterium]